MTSTPRIPLFASLAEDVDPGPLSPVRELGYPLARAPRPPPRPPARERKEAA
jgi:hypothetical protein